jgi:hypothetical protein
MVDRAGLVDRYAEGAAAVRAALEGASEAELDARPPDGGWTAREVVHHLADSEARSMIRLRQLLAEDSAEIQVYDQDEWAARLPYSGPIDAPLAVLDAVRSFSLLTLRTLDEGSPAWARAGRHVEWDEPYTVTKWLELYAEHPYEHADQIRAARASVG